MSRASLMFATLLTVVSAGLPGRAVAGGHVNVDYGSIFFRSKTKPGKNDPQGCLVGTVGRQEEKGSAGISVFLHPEGYKTTEPTSTISVIWGSHKNIAVHDGIEQRDPFRVCLRPGKYFVYAFGLSHEGTQLVQSSHFRVPVEVEAGKTKYIGAFVVMWAGQQDTCGGRQNSYRVLVRNREELDRQFLEAEATQAGQQFVVAPMDFSRLRPIVYACDA